MESSGLDQHSAEHFVENPNKMLSVSARVVLPVLFLNRHEADPETLSAPPETGSGPQGVTGSVLLQVATRLCLSASGSQSVPVSQSVLGSLRVFLSSSVHRLQTGFHWNFH